MSTKRRESPWKDGGLKINGISLLKRKPVTLRVTIFHDEISNVEKQW